MSDDALPPNGFADLVAAVHALDGRLKALESRQTVSDTALVRKATAIVESSLLVCTYTMMDHCGRKLFTVVGRKGFWASKRDWSDNNGTEMVLAVQDECRGRPRHKTLYHQENLSRTICGLLLAAQPEPVATKKKKTAKT